MLIGGSGDVGRRLVPLLLDHMSDSILVVSRAGNAPDDRAKALRLDIADADAAAGLPPGATVVNLSEATPPSIAAHIVRTGGRFLESSASPDYVQAITRAAVATGGPGMAVVCTGTAPGLSTLMAAEIAQMKGCATIDIGLELGMGRHYGAAATEWSIGAVGTVYRLSGVTGTMVRPGDMRRSFAFQRTGRERPALGIGFPQQGIAGRSGTSSTVRARTFLAFDPPHVTRLVWLLLRLGLGPALMRRKHGLTRILMRLPSLGRTCTRIEVEAQGPDGGVLASRHLTAGDQAEVTAAMILATIRAIHSEEAPLSGATTIVDHLTLSGALDALRGLLPEMPIETWTTGTDGERA
ncbi:hypothetical protein [Halovulum marinum]|uniref:hypothetical protein n=1 Tax=Halovulum marinum TaxID=2662447 RepID=UPI001F3CEC84|nr:hypothetical protein [Halovulum marinum]